MKRLLCIVLCLLLLAGCSAKAPEGEATTTSPAESTQPSVPETTKAAVEIPDAPSIMPPPILPADTTAAADLVETDFYTITLPGEWPEATGYTLAENRLTLFEKQSKLEGLGGRLFTLQVLPVQEDYTYYPSYELLGKFLADGVEYNLVATFPTDVQFSFERANLYNALYDQIPQVFASLQPANGYTFTPAE